MQASYSYNTQYPRPPPPQTLNPSSGSPNSNSASGYNASGNVNLGTATRRPVQVKPAQTNGEGSRDSNALRASVLDAAIALGFGTNRTVENWMFNTVAEEDEEDEDEIRTSPSLTNGSSATSTPGPSTSTSPFPTPAYTQLHNRPFPNAETYIPSSPAPAAPPTPRSKNKLRKARRGDDGYISDSTGPQPLKSAKSKRSKSKGPSGGGDSSDEGGGYFSDFARRRKSKKKDKSKDKDKSPREMPDDGEESDGGYLSEATKKKRGFFRLKSSKSHKASAAQPPPVPAMPPKLPSMATSTSSLSADIDWDRRESQDRARSTTPMAAVRPKESFDSFATMSTSTEDDDAWTAETPNTSMSGHGMGASSIGHGSKRSDGIGSSSHGHGSSNDHGASLGNDLGAGEFGAKKGVRFTPSTRFSGPALQTYAPEPVSPSPRVPALPASPSPAATAQRQQLLLSISPPYALAPKPTPSPTPSDFSFVSATEGVEPSTDYLVPSPSVTPVPPARSPDDVLTPQSGSDTISPQSTYIVPSPSAPNFQRGTSPLPSAGYIVPSPSTPTFSHAYQQPPQRGYQPYSRGRTPEPRPYTPDSDRDDDLEPPRAPHLRVNVNASPTRSRSSHMDIPPPTPPPSGPLPDVPPGGEMSNGNGNSPSPGGGSGFRFPPPSPSVRDAPRGRSPLLASYSPTPPSAYAPSPVPPSSFGQPSVSSRPPSRAASPGPIMRGRESPFPVRPARPIIAVSAPAEDEYELEPESPVKRGRPAAWNQNQSSSPQTQTQRMTGQWSATRERERFLAATGGRDSPMAPGPFQLQNQNGSRDGALLTPSSSIRRKPTLVNHRAELSLQALVYPEGSGEGRVTSAIVPESVTGFSDSDAGGVRESAFSDGGQDEGLGYLSGERDSNAFLDLQDERSGSAFSNVERTYDGEGVHARVGSSGAYAYAVNGRESTISMGDVLERTYGRESVYEDEGRPESVYDDGNDGRRESTYSLGGALRAGVRGSAYDDGAQDPRAMFGRESVYDDQDDASVYPPSQRTVDSYYFGNGSRPASIVDEQRSGDMRSKLMQRVGRGDDIVPPVPPLPRGANRAPAPF